MSITYGFFGEDRAQRNFLEKYLHRQYPETFIEDETERWRFKAASGPQVDRLMADALRQRAIIGLDILFVGRDIDRERKLEIKTRQDHYASKCANHPVVLMLPVQCIEYWLWYIKRHQEEPGKNTQLESQTRFSAKQAVYGETNLVSKQILIADGILSDLDASWLEQRSESFKHFHKQVTSFLTTYNKT